LQSLGFGVATNALIDVPGGPTGATSNFVVNLPSRPQQTTFVIRPATAGSAMTVPLIVTDSCGAWPTFVGAGPDGGPDAGLQAAVSAHPAAQPPQNTLRALRFGAATNARIDAPGHVEAPGGFVLDLLPGAPQATFFVRQMAAAGRFSVPIVAVDDCGEWSTT